MALFVGQGQQAEIFAHETEVLCADLSPDGRFSPNSRWLAVANRSGRVQVFDISTGESVCGPLAGHLAGTVRVDFSADSKSLVTYSSDRTAKIWNFASGREMISGLRLTLQRHFQVFPFFELFQATFPMGLVCAVITLLMIANEDQHVAGSVLGMG